MREHRLSLKMIRTLLRYAILFNDNLLTTVMKSYEKQSDLNTSKNSSKFILGCAFLTVIVSKGASLSFFVPRHLSEKLEASSFSLVSLSSLCSVFLTPFKFRN